MAEVVLTSEAPRKVQRKPGHQAPTHTEDSGLRPDTEAGTRSVCSLSRRPPAHRGQMRSRRPHLPRM